MPDHPFAALCYALDATTGRTWHPDDDGAHTTGWIWRVERIGSHLHLTTGTVLVAEVEQDHDPWVTAEAIGSAIAAHTARITTTTEELTL